MCHEMSFLLHRSVLAQLTHTAIKVSGLNRTALGRAVYASQWRSPDTTQDALPAARPSLAGRDLVAGKVATKGF